GWAIPNTAWSTTVQTGRLICSDGLLDLTLDAPGLSEIHAEGFCEINPLFRNLEKNGSFTGYGIRSPGRLFQQILAFQDCRLSSAETEVALSPMTLGFYTTLVLEGAETSLATGKKLAEGTTLGAKVDLRCLLAEQLGSTALRQYKLE